MLTQTLHIDVFALQNGVDPTRTTALRNLFARDMRRRFDELCRVIAQAIVVKDCFGLNRPTVFQMTPPGEQAFAFPLSKDKMEAFMIWLQEQVDKGILTVGDINQLGLGYNEAWTNKYIFDSYKRGMIRARMEMQKVGMDVPSIDQTGGVEISMGTPLHIDRLGLLYARVFSDLKGVTDAMDAQISRVLAQGLADGDGPRLLARKLVSVINGDGADKLGITDTLGRFIPAKRRAEMIARTETIRAHHMATIQEYRNWAVIDIIVQAEWMTAGDNRVCDRCASMQGNIYTLDQIEGMIPLHPQCRCIALPYVEGMPKISTEIMPKGRFAGTKR
jgi:SPP1 gp7 family putative phage head morphogenesis protein